MSENKLVFERLNPFEMTIHYVDDQVESIYRQLGHHVHSECEIYFHLGGDVSFMVEDQVYPIQYGNLVITRPNEYHHCIYHTETRHRHFWILFSGEQNERLLSRFFSRQKGRHNLLSLGKEQTQELVEVCCALCAIRENEIERYALFFRLLQLLEEAREIGDVGGGESSDLTQVLRVIHQNYAGKLSVRALAEQAHISVSTLERRFEESLGMSPSTYVKKIRLANAARLLSEQCSVTEAAERSGFSDVSAFIAAFRKNYGASPLQYKKRIERQSEQ